MTLLRTKLVVANEARGVAARARRPARMAGAVRQRTGGMMATTTGEATRLGGGGEGIDGSQQLRRGVAARRLVK